MTIISAGFLIFFFVTLILYYILAKWQWIVLLAASYLFYMYFDPAAVIFLILTTVSTFYAGLLIGRNNKVLEDMLAKSASAPQPTSAQESLPPLDKKALKAKYKQKNKRIVALALLLLFGMLAFFKYTGFLMISVNRILERISDGGTIPILDILLPLGISFYIFQSAGYIIDVYRGKYVPDRNLAKFALFVSFFPQIIQGPIGRYDRLSKQFYAVHNFDYTVVKYGIQLILWGLFKKMIIADRAALLVNEVFGNYLNHGGAVIFIGVIFYCIQIYCDFSGGIDVCRGVAQCFGIILDENFKRPFFSRSVAEFWQRWHITLGSWMRDYLFYPLSLSKSFGRLGKFARSRFGNRIGKLLPAYLATFIVFTVIGIWHGANWKYVAFGFYNGILITFAMILEPLFEKALQRLHIDRNGRLWNSFRLARTFFLICIGRYFTRADSLLTALRMLKRTFTVPLISELSGGVLLQLGLQASDFVIMFIAVLVLLGASLTQERGVEIRKSLEQKSAAVQVSVMLLALVAIIFLGVYRQGYIASQFIYAQF